MAEKPIWDDACCDAYQCISIKLIKLLPRLTHFASVVSQTSMYFKLKIEFDLDAKWQDIGANCTVRPYWYLQLKLHSFGKYWCTIFMMLSICILWQKFIYTLNQIKTKYKAILTSTVGVGSSIVNILKINLRDLYLICELYCAIYTHMSVRCYYSSITVSLTI